LRYSIIRSIENLIGQRIAETSRHGYELLNYRLVVSEQQAWHIFKHKCSRTKHLDEVQEISESFYLMISPFALVFNPEACMAETSTGWTTNKYYVGILIQTDILGNGLGIHLFYSCMDRNAAESGGE